MAKTISHFLCRNQDSKSLPYSTLNSMVRENYAWVEILSRDIFISVQACTHNFSSRVGCWVTPRPYIIYV